MSLLLCLETSSKNCSVAVSSQGLLVGVKDYFDDNYCHGEKLHVLIEELLFELKLDLTQIDGFVFSVGPGSYTGLRIGATAIKGLAVVTQKEVVLVSTLQSLAWGFLNDKTENSQYDFLCPVLDSRKDEVYTAMYDSDLTQHLSPFACEINNFRFEDYLENNKICFFGPGNYKLKTVIKHQNAYFSDHIYPSSKYLGVLGKHLFDKKMFADLAYFEPLYLKPFICNK